MSEKRSHELWEVVRSNEQSATVGAVGGSAICRLYCEGPRNRKGKARAQQIVREHNSHADLLTALRELKSLTHHLTIGPLDAAAQYGPDYRPPTEEDVRGVYTKVNDAIAKAEKVQS
ncbi:unnamed protein product [marine sediment metagenome]|uniref:Uncharacterized protein n=1 Tax=marine sediment metagenome TaxID=412755 RepID=X0TT56_9ZZZZ